MQAELLGARSECPAWRERLARLVPAMVLAGSRFGGVGLQFLVQICVGALAGPYGLGVLQLFASWSSMVGEGFARGLPAWAMRVVAVDTSRGNATSARDNLAWAVQRIVALALVVGLLALLLLALIDDWPAGVYRGIALAVILGAPLFALLRLGADALKGAGEALLAVSIENLVLPGLLLLVCAVCWVSGQTLGVTVLLCTGVAGLALALWAVWKAMPAQLRATSNPSDSASDCLHDRSDINALWANSLLAVAFLQLPFLLLPWYASPDEIGIYAVAHKLVNIVTTLLILLSAIFGPAFAKAAADGGVQGLQRLLRRTQWLSCVIFLPLCAALLLAVEPLALVFNVPSGALWTYLAILAAGQLVNAATGLSGVLLNMAGGAALETRTLAGSLVIAMVAAPAVGAAHGVPGLAVLFSIVLAGKNLASYLAVVIFLSRKDGLA
jgi:O-antigen/teichoic acid export membrane protein